MSDKIRAPFTPEQVDALTTYQTAGFMHPFTCGGGGGPHSDVSLYAQADGWHCPVEDCTHRQDWAHTFMADRRYWPDIRTGHEVSAMSDDNHSRDERADAFVHPDYVRAAVSAIQAAHAGGSRSVEFFDEVRIGLSAALPLALADLREQLAAANEHAEEAAAKVARKDQVLSLVVAMKKRAEWQRDEAKARVAELHTWRGLMALLDEHYPADVQLGDPTDPGPRILALTREMDRLRARLDGLGEGRVLMYRIIGAIEHAYALNTYVELEPGKTAPTVESLWAEVRELLGVAPDAAADGHSATQTGGDRHSETTPDGTGTGTTHA